MEEDVSNKIRVENYVTPSAIFGNKRSSRMRNPSRLNEIGTKWIQVYINGDEYFPGARCVVNNKYYRSFDAFLNYLTERLKPSFGAVRKIYTPVRGHTVQNLEDLIPNHKYVVAGTERFRKVEPGYAEIGGKGSKKTVSNQSYKNKNKVTKPKVFRPPSQRPLTLHAYKNGYYKMKPVKFTFYAQELENWDTIFQKISKKLQCGSVKRFYTLDGKPLRNTMQLENEQSYVVVTKYEIFKSVPYGKIHQKTNSSAKKIRNNTNSGKNSLRLKNYGSSAQSNSSRPFSISSYGQPNKEKPFKETISRNSCIENIDSKDNKMDHQSDKGEVDSYLLNYFSDEDSIFKVKENLRNISLGEITEISLDDDISGVYKAKTQNALTVGAIEIPEDSNTAVEFPIDFLNAEEVEDEITPDMERSLQHLSLDVPEQLVAYLPSMQGKQTTVNEQTVSSAKFIPHSRNINIRNIYA